MSRSGLAVPARQPGQAVALGVASGITVAAMWWRFGLSPALSAYLALAATCMLVTATDLAERRVPNRAVLSALVAGAALLAMASGLGDAWWQLARAVLAAGALAAFYLALGLASNGGMGMGDAKWACVLGLYLGWLGWEPVVAGTLLAFLAAAAVVAVRSVVMRPSSKSALPFAPFMAAGALVAVLVIR